MAHRLADGHPKDCSLSLTLTSPQKCMNGQAKPLQQTVIFSMKLVTGQKTLSRIERGKHETCIILPLPAVITFNIGAAFHTLLLARVPMDTLMVIVIQTSYGPKLILSELLIINPPVLQSLACHSLSPPPL